MLMVVLALDAGFDAGQLAAQETRQRVVRRARGARDGLDAVLPELLGVSVLAAWYFTGLPVPPEKQSQSMEST